MIASSFTFLDFIMIGIVFLSAGYGFLRGFTREFLTIGGWIFAAFITLYSLPTLKPVFRSWIGHDFFADVTAALVVFIFSLIVCSLIIRLISESVQSSLLKSLDRTMGLLFGIFRGFFLLILSYGLIVFIWPVKEDRPQVVNHSRLMPLVHKGAYQVARYIPHDLMSRDVLHAFTPSEGLNTEDMIKQLAKPQAKTLKKSGHGDYSSSDREKIQDLFKDDE